MPSVGWSGVKLAFIELWSSGNAFFGVKNHLHHLAVHGRNNGLGLFFMVRARPLSSSEGKS
jgi:hypothetical protein